MSVAAAGPSTNAILNNLDEIPYLYGSANYDSCHVKTIPLITPETINYATQPLALGVGEGV